MGMCLAENTDSSDIYIRQPITTKVLLLLTLRHVWISFFFFKFRTKPFIILGSIAGGVL